MNEVPLPTIKERIVVSDDKTLPKIPPEDGGDEPPLHGFRAKHGPARLQIIVWALQAMAAIATIMGAVYGIRAL